METPAEIAHDHEHSTYFKGLEEGEEEKPDHRFLGQAWAAVNTSKAAATARVGGLWQLPWRALLGPAPCSSLLN